MTDQDNPRGRIIRPGPRGRLLGLAGLGLCALPLVMLVLIWRESVIVAGMAPLLAIGSATVAAVATLVGLDLMLRPDSPAGQLLRQLFGEGRQVVLRQSDPTDRLALDAQQLIDELVAQRAERDQTPATPQDSGRVAIAAALNALPAGPRAVAVLRTGLPLRPGSGALLAGQTVILQALVARVQALVVPSPVVSVLADGDIAMVLPLADADPATVLALSLQMEAILPKLARPILNGMPESVISPDLTSSAAELAALPVVPVLLLGLAIHQNDNDPLATLDKALAAVATAALGAPVVLHGPGLRDAARDKAQLEQELQDAIARQEFELYFQPIMDVAAHQPIGAEALIRWNSPRRGFVAPGMFLPAAEACGLIDPIGDWVLAEACRQAATWGGPMRVAVNLGARQFLDEDLTWHVAKALTDARLRPDLLELGLSERVLMLDPDHSRTTIAALRDLGVQVAIDDFGNGAADMRSLSQISFDTLKIDRRFVTDVHLNPASAAICDALLAFAKGLGCAVLAEGTEQAGEVAHLAGRGCTLFQGYYFARPVAAPVLAATFDNLRPRLAG